MKLLRITAADMPDIVISGYSDADLNQQLVKTSIETLESEKARLYNLYKLIKESLESGTNLNPRYLIIELDKTQLLISKIESIISDLEKYSGDFDCNLNILRRLYKEVVIDDIAEYVTVCKFADLGKCKI